MVKKIIFSALLLITPLFFAPFTISLFSTNKNTLISLIALLLLAITGYKHLTTKKHYHQSSLFIFSLGLFWSAMGLDIFLTREARIESLVNKGVLFLALPVITYFIATAKKSTKSLQYALTALITAGTILALHGILQLAILTELTILPIWMRSISFSPAGSILSLLATVTFSLIATVAWSIKEKNITKKTTLLAAAGLQLSALVSYGFMLAQGELVIPLLPLKASWSLALDAIKNVRELFLGIGLANFPVLFTQFKPVSLIPAEFWNTVFQTASNEILQLLATTGLLGLGSFIFLIITTIKNSLKLENTPLTLSLRLTIYAVIISFFLVPAGVITYTFFFVLAGLIAAHHPHQTRKEVTLPGYTRFITATIFGAIIITSGYFTYRVYAAEVLMQRAQLAFARNNAEDVYAAHIEAVRQMPQITNYRISLSQINLTLASSVSQSQTEGTDSEPAVELTTQQREQISTLVQRAIEQGRVATNLRPSLYSTWQNLGGIYRNLINVISGSEEFALQYLEQAVKIDPANPVLRVEYGGLFYQLSQLVEDEEVKINLLNQSIQQFQVAVSIKPDYANGYYNLANALDKNNDPRRAYQAMTQAMANIDPNSQEYEQAQQELLILEEKLPKVPQQKLDNQLEPQREASELQPPASLPSPLPGGLIELPPESDLEVPAEEKDTAATGSAETESAADTSP